MPATHGHTRWERAGSAYTRPSSAAAGGRPVHCEHWLSMGKTRLVGSYWAPRTDINRRLTEGELYLQGRDVLPPGTHARRVPPRQRVSAEAPRATQ